MRWLLLTFPQATLSLLALFFVTIVLHEGVHYLTALITGVPFDRFTWFSPATFSPALFSAASLDTPGYFLVSLSGGLITGGVLLAVLFIGRRWWRRSLFHWLSGLYLSCFGCWQLAVGMLEGAWHDEYIQQATTLLSPLSLVSIGALLVGLIAYGILIPRPYPIPP